MKSIKGIDLRHFSYFIAVAEQKSFSRAARLLNIAQPPLSSQIKDMESRIGAKLFLRDRRGILLTEAGRALLPEAHKILEHARSAVQHTRMVGQGRAGRLRLGMISSASYNPHIIQCLQNFSKEMPDVALDMVQVSSLDQHRALAEDRLDLGFHWSWQKKPSSEFDTHIFTAQELSLVIPACHRRATNKNADPANFAAETWLVPGAKYNPAWHDVMLDIFRRAHFMPQRIVEKNPAHLLLSMITAGQGVALMPEFMASQAQGVIFLPLIPHYRPYTEITLCLSKRRLHQDGLIADFFKLMAT